MKCKCDCGKEKSILGYSLTHGLTQSCGCLRDEKRKTSSLIHGLYKTRIHKTWRGLFQRCENPTASHYERYGGRGIRICEEWKGKNGFVNFYEWSMKNGYSDSLELDRIDNNKGYSPDNCRWVNHLENCHNKNNRRDNKTGYSGVQTAAKYFLINLGRIPECAAFVKDYYDFMDMEEPVQGTEKFYPDFDRIKLQQVCFSYPSQTDQASVTSIPTAR